MAVMQMAGIYVTGVNSSFETPVMKKSANSEKAGYIGSKRDKLDISEEGKDFLLVGKTLGEVPDIRVEIIAPLKAAYESGAYNIDAGDIADKILDGFKGF